MCSYTGKKIDKAGIVAFATGILSGDVEPEFASQEIPEKDMDGDVKIVVGKSFEKIVKDPSKDVLLEVRAPVPAHTAVHDCPRACLARWSALWLACMQKQLRAAQGPHLHAHSQLAACHISVI